MHFIAISGASNFAYATDDEVLEDVSSCARGWRESFPRSSQRMHWCTR